MRDVDESRDEGATPSVPATESIDEHGTSVAVAVRPSTDVVPVDSSEVGAFEKLYCKFYLINPL